MLAPTLFKLQEVLHAPDVVHAVRASYQPGRKLPVHGHDFAEIMWIESGSGSQLVNGRRERLEPGSVRLLTARDTHSIAADWAQAMVLVNVAFPERFLDECTERAGLEALGCMSRSGDTETGVGNENPRAPLSGAGLRELREAFDRLVPGRRLEAFVRRFLLDVACIVQADEVRRGQTAPEDGPAWLVEALRWFRGSDEAIARGAEAFIARCGRSRDHVNRALKGLGSGMTISSVVATARVERAAVALATSGTEVATIAFDLGFGNLAYFYRQFKRRYGVSPGAYRDQALRIARG
jgi:AraC family cel operon transcriptional repressor